MAEDGNANNHASAIKLLEMEEGKDDKGLNNKETNTTTSNPVIKGLVMIPNTCKKVYSSNEKACLIALYSSVVIAFVIYFIMAVVYSTSGALPLMILSASVLVVVLLEITVPKLISSCMGSNASLADEKKNENLHSDSLARFKKIMRILILLFFVGLSLFVIIDTFLRNPKQIVSLVGLIVIVIVCVMGSKYPNQIDWQPVIWGICMQFLLGLLILRTSFGYHGVKFIGDQVAMFMTYSDAGSKFVFGEDFQMHFFAFKVLPMIVFFSTVMNMLYYIGAMQWFIGKLAWVTQVTLGTSAIESTVAVANIFVGMTQAPLVVRPYLKDLTNAEIHSVLTCGLGSIAFSVFGAFVDFGIDPVHLLTACVMSAPAGLVISRLLYPERNKSKFTTTSSLKMSGRSERNIVEAAAAGASMSIGLVANIAANLIAFLALLKFINATLSWFGSFVGQDNITFQVVCGYLFTPLAFLMGADWEDCGMVGEFFGVKSFLNEFIAYKTMKPFVENRIAGGPKFINGTQMYMSERSEMIAIHALCGFCNVSSLGIIVGGLSVLMPSRKKDLAQLAVRALMGGALTCCMTASIAGLLYVEGGPSTVAEMLNTTMAITNTTMASVIANASFPV